VRFSRLLPALVATVCLLLLGAQPAGAAGASPAQPACGQVITHSIALQADVTGCTGPGLVVGADGITIDLGGHTIAGAVTTVTQEQCEKSTDGDFFDCRPCGAARFDPCGPPFTTPEGYTDEAEFPFTLITEDAAIDNTAGHDRVTVRNGGVKDFLYGARVIGGDKFKIAGLKASANGESPLCLACVENSRFGQVDGIESVRLTDVSDSLIRRSRFVNAERADRNNFEADSFASLSDGSDRNVIEHMAGGEVGGFHQVIVDGGTGNVIRHNAFDEAEAVFLESSSGNVVEHNSFTGGHDFTASIGLFGATGNVIRHNRITTLADQSRQAAGIFVCSGSSRNVIADNVLSRLVSGIDTDCADPSNPAVGNIIRGNRISDIEREDFFGDATGNGILLTVAARDTLVERNFVSHAVSNGIAVLDPSTRLSRNRADFNGILGIWAPFGAVDLGHNKARHNGNPAQCVGVRC
jgi:hypothetical protein